MNVMPHTYNTRQRKNQSESDIREICTGVLNDILIQCCGEEGNMSQPSTSQREVSQLTEGEDSQVETQTSTRRQPKRRGKRTSSAVIADALERFSNRLDIMDQRIEQQEQRSVRLSINQTPSAHSSPKSPSSNSHRSRARKRLPSPDDLRSDALVQAGVSNRMKQLNDVSRSEEPGMYSSKPLKSGRYRLGDQRVLCAVAWPHEYVAIGPDLMMPPYDELNPLQWTQGFAMNVLLEKDKRKRDIMLLHMCRVMQDADELNWWTAKRAHAGVLQEMERGHLTWDDKSDIDDTRRRYTQRAIKEADRRDGKQIRICTRYNENRCDKEDGHIEKKVVYKHSCMKCWKAKRENNPHRESECPRPRKSTNAYKEKQQV